eukprot:TRINITY_DN1509_c0_g2_i2.p1 TRINITY_DN1509_c0_g2~~TRINITY_DN1509_c0_g2_i2.p1  ORF type:complete len:280 (-),score=80.51 TRINITY_DN1509_c0_g2_i2:50-889(-)
MAWEPFHRNPECRRLITASKDGTLIVWDTVRGVRLFSMTGHTKTVTCVKWGGQGLVYSASQDRTIKVWSDKDGKLVRTLDGHGHWVNTMALCTEYAMRIGPYNEYGVRADDIEQAQKDASERYNKALASGVELMVSGSDDFTMFLWDPVNSKKYLERMTGHQQLVNQVSFSPDGNYIASASFDKSIKIWDGKTGKFVGTCRGHVGAVYQVAWSSDSRMIASGSKDSTLKLWDLKKARRKKMLNELPGHADEVYAVDWSPDGQRVASGSKDRYLKLWRSA